MRWYGLPYEMRYDVLRDVMRYGQMIYDDVWIYEKP